MRVERDWHHLARADLRGAHTTAGRCMKWQPPGDLPEPAAPVEEPPPTPEQPTPEPPGEPQPAPEVPPAPGPEVPS